MKTKYIFSVLLPDNDKKFLNLFILENLGKSIDKKLEGFVNKTSKKKKGLDIIPQSSFLIIKEEILPFYNILKKFSSFMIKEIQDYYEGIGTIIGINQKDFECFNEYYCILGKESTILSWYTFYEVACAICLLDKNLTKTGIIYQKEIIEE